MSFEIQMPHVGESVTEAVIDKWLKKPGDRIEKYEPIVEVITDKVAMEIPSPATGELTRIVAEEGATVAMGAVIAEMRAEDVVPRPAHATATETPVSPTEPSHNTPAPAARTDKPASATTSGLRMAQADRVGSMITAANVGPTGGAFSDTSLGGTDTGRAATPEGDAVSSASEPSPASEKGFARLSPAVRRLIETHGIDLSSIVGTGVGGRITRADVMLVVEGDNAPAVTTTTQSAGGKLQKPSPVRRMIADHMSKSFREIPHAWSAVEVNVSGLVACRAANRDSVRQRTGANLTYLPFVMAVTAAALRANPLLNSSWQTDGILSHNEINIGIAAAGKDGLVVPVIRAADAKSVLELAQELSVLVERARDGKLSLEDVSGGTFTLNNTGVLGSVWGGAIINHPQAAILTTEAIVKRPVVIEGPNGDDIQVRPVMNICLSFDHRVIDGAEASAFLQDVKRGLEQVSKDTALE